MFPKLRMMGLALAAFGLFACNQQEKIADPAKGREGTGAARIALPPIPVGYLDSGSGGQAWFALTVTGTGMEPIRQTWKLSPNGHENILVRNIPAGAIRLFHGELLRISGGDSAVTHEGEASAWIDRDSVAEVQLFLGKSGGGTAHVCVEVEGWPSDSSCIKPPTPSVPDFSGCWNVTTYAYAVPPELHQLVEGRLTFTQTDTLISARVLWSTGEVDSGYGFVRTNDGTAIIEHGGFYFKGRVDTNSALFGALASAAKGVRGDAKGKRVGCAEPFNPARPQVAQACYKFSHNADTGSVAQGRLVLQFQGNQTWGAFFWSGYRTAAVSRSTFQGSPTTRAYVELNSAMDGSSDTLTYRGALAGVGSSTGTVHQSGRSPSLGRWTADRVQCATYESL